jgi:hypothetical protein
MLSDNRSQLISVSVQGSVSSPEYPTLPASPYLIGADGAPALRPGPGGIVYNVRVGDSAYGWLAEMVQPGASIKNAQDGPNQALNVLACIGNEAVVVSGRAASARGTVTGKSGRFAEHVIVDFPREVLEQLAIEDRVLVRAHGRSLALAAYPDVQIKSLSPRLLDSMGLEDDGSGNVLVPVAAEVPAILVGAGAGLLSESACVSIQTDHAETLRQYGLDRLRLGDIVAIHDYDSRWGHGYRRGSVAIGVVAHGDSLRAGYGPGVTTIMTALNARIQPQVREGCNIADLLSLRERATVTA